MNLSNIDQSKMLVRVGDDGLSVKQAVKEWKRNNKYLWTAWLDGTSTNVMTANSKGSQRSDKSVTQTVQVPETRVDKTAPVLDVEDRITVTERNYTISGTVSDESDVFVEADGISVPVKNNQFIIQGSSSIGITKYRIGRLINGEMKQQKTLLLSE